jgi:NADPH-dependent F420 reductase
MSALAFLGGTGAQGFGLALRFAVAGEAIVVGSRSIERARATADAIRSAVPSADVRGCENGDAIDCCERVVLTVPFEGLVAFLGSVRERLAGKLLVDVIVPLGVRDGFFEPAPVSGAASAGELIQGAIPTARVVSAFKHHSAELLRDLARPLEGDVLLCGNDPAARAAVATLVARIPGLRAVDAGGIANARYLEAITPLLLNLNRRHRARTSIQILGV